MRVLFDAFWWVNGPVSNRQVLHEIVLAWSQQFPQDELVLAVRGRDIDVVRATFDPSVELVATRLAPQGISAILELPFLARRVKADVTFSHNFTPLFGTSAVFLHDVLFVTNPEWFTRKELLYFSLMPFTSRFADVVLTSSHSEAARIRTNIRGPKKVVPVGLAMNRELQTLEGVRPDLNARPGHFILTVGRLNVRKNLEFTCTAALASDRVSPTFPLVIAGGYQGRSTVLSDEIRRGVEDGRIVFLGHVSNPELVWLYRNAAAFVFMTLDEGFGLPPLEAKWFGTPVVTSDIPVMKEVAGSSASFVDPRDEPALSRALNQVQPRNGAKTEDDGRYSWPNVVRAIRGEMASLIAQRSKAAHGN
ncbi:glycosyltransferase family 4 protein [Herbiconiux ginsengi]|uniref:Glycosyltransferase involved in cell wall bisynthesis n=1 Tax=Herbiconiux ginsengi TaxID=381665 RepID=A0A1H3SMU6_9MICO|nr:glycosyltransferase family 1 protein [Herbiconiux ginsengi]SDZ39306.1 Glycosyltransferase involved in cell wall bisynthesis [Herbiconiux ginsengi]